MNQPSVCKHLRTKAMFIPALAYELAAQPEGLHTRSAHYWCNCTVTETGPDDAPVAPHRCKQNRHCFEA